MEEAHSVICKQLDTLLELRPGVHPEFWHAIVGSLHKRTGELVRRQEHNNADKVSGLGPPPPVRVVKTTTALAINTGAGGSRSGLHGMAAARHAGDRPLPSPRFASRDASPKRRRTDAGAAAGEQSSGVGPAGSCSCLPRRVVQRTLNPRPWSYMAPNDVASNIRQAL